MQFSDFKQFMGHFWPPKASFTETDYPDLSGKVYIVTGGPTGIGYQVARLLAMKNAKVWIAARSETKTEEAITKIKQEIPKANLEYFLVDFSDLATVKPGVQKFLDSESQLHGIVHNAGVMTPPPGTQTKQGFDLELGVNCLGPFLLQTFLNDILINTAKTAPKNSVRIIWVSSSAHVNGVDKTLGVDWLASAEQANKLSLYGRSKAINVAQAILWPKHHPGTGIVSVSAHPGNLKTELQRNSSELLKMIGNMLLFPAINGAYTELYGLLSPELTTKNNGAYLIPWGQIGFASKLLVSKIEGARGEQLWKWLDEQTKAYQ